MFAILHGITTQGLKVHRRSMCLTIADAKFGHLVKRARTRLFHVDIYYPLQLLSNLWIHSLAHGENIVSKQTFT